MSGRLAFLFFQLVVYNLLFFIGLAGFREFAGISLHVFGVACFVLSLISVVAWRLLGVLVLEFFGSIFQGFLRVATLPVMIVGIAVLCANWFFGVNLFTLI